MQPLYDYRKFAILYVDDEEKSLKNFARAFSEDFRVLTAPSAQEGLKVLAPQFVKAVQPDPWGHPYQYVCPGKSGLYLFENLTRGR